MALSSSPFTASSSEPSSSCGARTSPPDPFPPYPPRFPHSFSTSRPCPVWDNGLALAFGSTRVSPGPVSPCERRATCLPMKPVRLVLTPTRHRRLNELIGLLVLASAVLLFLSLISWHPTDPSFNTDSLGPTRNWIGPAGAFVSDVLLQIEGLSAFFLPLLVG